MLKGQKKGEKSGIFKKCFTCDIKKYVKPYQISTWKFCSVKCRGIDQRGKASPRLGVILTKETRLKLSNSHKGQIAWNKGLKGFMAGKDHYNWKGGITPINKAIRESLDYEQWRKEVFERDLYTCQGCYRIGGKLEADHIKPFSLFPEFRFDINNGRTLCEICHEKLGAKVNQYSTKNNYKEAKI